MVINTRIAWCLIAATSCLQAGEQLPLHKLTLQAKYLMDYSGHNKTFCHIDAQEDGSLRVTQWYKDPLKKRRCCDLYELTSNSNNLTRKSIACSDSMGDFEQHQITQTALTKSAKEIFGTETIGSYDATFLPETKQLILASKTELFFYTVEPRKAPKHKTEEAALVQEIKRRRSSTEKESS